MKNRLFAMDTHFMFADPPRPVKEQAALIKESGYDDYYHLAMLPDAVKLGEKITACREVGVGMHAVYVTLDVSVAPTEESLLPLADLLKEMTSPMMLEVSINLAQSLPRTLGDPAHDEKALAWLRALLPHVEKSGVCLVLYAHVNFWMETMTDAMRLARKAASPHVGVAFCGYHFYRVGRESAADLIADAGALLKSVNLNGSRHISNPEDVVHELNPSIEPVDAGTMDNAAVIAELKRHGYTGPIGIQGYGVNAPPRGGTPTLHGCPHQNACRSLTQQPTGRILRNRPVRRSRIPPRL
jgi:sugar phosphate isomerase/epimerase